MTWEQDYFQPRCEQAMLFNNEVSHLPELPTLLPDAKIVARVETRRAAKLAHGDWFAANFGKE